MLPTLGVAHSYLRAFDSVNSGRPRVRTAGHRPSLARVRMLVTRRQH